MGLTEVKANTWSVPMVAIIGYAAFVVVSSILVGVLPAVVNLPECEETAVESPVPAKVMNEFARMEPIPDDSIARLQHGHPVKRFAELEKSNDVARISNKQLLREKSKQDSKVQASRALLNKKNSRAVLPVCPELTNPPPESSLWSGFRLPGNLVPTSYEITINIAGLDAATTSYTGSSVININVLNTTQYLVLHARFDNAADIEVMALTDRTGADIPRSCAFLTDEFYVIKTTAAVTAAQGPIKLTLNYKNDLEKYESGLFKVRFNEGDDESAVIMTKFEPIDAREAFPCFDEPGYKATYLLTLNHPAGTTALSNTVGNKAVSGSALTTTFAVTPKLPVYLLGFVVFKDAEFSSVTKKSASNKDVKLWANVEYINAGYADGPLEMAVKLFDAYENEMFKDVTEGAPPKIDIFASPDYPTNGIPHFGFPIFKENQILFVNSSLSERNKQDVAFLFAKILSQFWFGNYVTFAWWNELWLQEALGNYAKYKIFEYAYPEIPIEDQFSVEEMIYVLFDDAYPSTHPVIKPSINSPYEIEGYFDIVETSKATAILRMAEYELAGGAMNAALTAYLKKNPWGTGNAKDLYDAIGTVRKWPASDFFDRWFRQSNYPYVKISIEKSGAQTYLNLEQSRHLNSPNSIFGNITVYPSPYDWTWYVPLNCFFGDTPDDSDPIEREFDLDTKTARLLIPNNGGKNISWVYCNLEFYGYFLAEYTSDNWFLLSEALEADNKILEPLDRVAILNDVFANAYTERETYFAVVNVLDYIKNENDYLPWRAVYKYIRDLADILQYRKTFYSVSQYIASRLERFNITAVWSSDNTDIAIVPDRSGRFVDNHIPNLWKETLIRLGTELQVKPYLEKASSYWEVAESEILSGAFKDDLPPFIRASVYDFHIQNTYDILDWDILFRLYEGVTDFIEERRYLEALTYPRLPWLLAKYLESFENNLLRQYDFFEVVRKMSKNPLGREIVWDYIRINKEKLIAQYSLEDIRLGQMIIDVSENFENDFLYGELIQYVFTTPSGASNEAYLQALETVTANVQWLKDNERDIDEAFSGERRSTSNHEPKSRINLSPRHQSMLQEIYKRAGRI